MLKQAGMGHAAVAGDGGGGRALTSTVASAADVRLSSEQWSSYRPLDFERHLCTPGPQAAVKAVWRNSQMLGRAAIVPNNATCRADPTSPECSVPLEHGRRDKAPLRYLRS